MKNVLVAAAIGILTLLTWLQFPGHTWLQQDSQIYAPILEHIWDPSALRNDILVERPHVAFTLYDEVAVALRAISGLDFRTILAIEQLITRALGIWGVYLIATACDLPAALALLAAAIFSLGATIPGPAVLTFEYEPTPRALAVPLLFCAIGFAAHGRDFAAGILASLAFLIHPPTVYPFWTVYFVLTLWPGKPENMRRRLSGWIPLLCATVLLLIAARYQAGIGETQLFFARLDPLQEKLQRTRASYNWISMWGADLIRQYVFLYAMSLLAFLRLRNVPLDLQFFLAGMPLVGILSMPVSYMLLEKMQWALIPQFQPMRAVLLVTAFAGILASIAGCRAAVERRLVEAVLWFALAYLIPSQTRVLTVPTWNRALVIVALACAAAASVWAGSRRRWGREAIAFTAIAAFFAIPGLGRVKNYPKLANPELEQLAQWARSSTPKDAVFLFPGAGRDLYPGMFRAEALRAVYVDWKGGGQVNYLKELGEQWWRRWQLTMAPGFHPQDVDRYAQLGIDYLVLVPKDRLREPQPVFENARFVVYRLIGRPMLAARTPQCRNVT